MPHASRRWRAVCVDSGYCRMPEIDSTRSRVDESCVLLTRHRVLHCAFCLVPCVCYSPTPTLILCLLVSRLKASVTPGVCQYGHENTRLEGRQVTGDRGGLRETRVTQQPFSRNGCWPRCRGAENPGSCVLATACSPYRLYRYTASMGRNVPRMGSAGLRIVSVHSENGKEPPEMPVSGAGRARARSREHEHDHDH